MKVEQEGPEFRPVRITLESQAEVEILATILGSTAGGKLADSFTYHLYGKLIEVAPDYHDRYKASVNGIHLVLSER